ncbi:GntR family transcriptional regulator, partial [Streptomyces parvulus]|nr:GntR family transcriptional regulator [Streptomyces parvulus]
MARTGDRVRAVTAPAIGGPDFTLDRGSPVPLYYQLAQQLEAAIEHGVL